MFLSDRVTRTHSGVTGDTEITGDAMSLYQPRNARRRSGVSKLLALLLPMLLAFGGVAMVQPPVAEAAGPHYVGYQATVSGITMTVGTYESLTGSGGHRVICIDSGADHPTSLKSPVSKLDPQVGYLMATYIDQTTSPATAAALATIVKTKYDQNQSKRKAAWNGLSSSQRTSTTERMTKLNAEAAQYAGPYSMTPTLAKTSTGKGVVTFGIKTGSGSYFPKVPITLTATNAVFTATGTSTLTVTSTGAAQTAEIKATNAAKVTVSATSATALPSTYWKKYTASDSNDQDMAGANFSPTSVTGAVAMEGFAAAPVLASTVGTSYAATGTTLTDRVSITQGIPGETVTVNTTVYGPLPAQPSTTALAAPAGTPVFQTLSTTATLDGSGAATVSFTSKATSAPGYYVWQESTAATGAMEASSSLYGRASETTSVGVPTIATTVSDQKSRIGDTISDTAAISGLNLVTNAATPLTVTLTGKLLGPIPQVDSSCDGLDWSTAPTAATIPSTPVTKNGSIADLGAFKVADSGCYTYTETLTGVAGGNTVWTVTHSPGKTSQTTFATANLVLSSQVSKQVAAVGEKLADLVKVRGIPEGTTVTVRSTLYGPLDAMPAAETDTVPDGTPVVEKFQTDVTGTADPDQQVTFTTTNPVKAAGIYVWVETADASADGIVEATSSAFGQVVETTRVVEPKLTTQASVNRAAINDTFSDTATPAGVADTIAMAQAASVSSEVTLTGKLLGPIAPVNKQCTNLDWSDAPTAATIDSQELAGDDPITNLGSLKATKPGCYTYTETLTAMVDGKQAWQVVHPAGVAEQTVQVVEPTITTQTSDDMVGLSAQITDQIVVSNMGGNSGTITARLYGPYYMTDDMKCTDVTAEQWQKAIDDGSLGVSADQTITIPGHGTFTTEPVATIEAGCYTWWERLDLGDPTNPSYTVITPLGDPSETTTVVSPTITTTAVSSTGEATGALFDDILIAGTHGMTGTITGKVLGPLPKNSLITCDNLDWSTAASVDIAPIKVNGDGTYKTKPVKPDSKGCYTFVETLTMDDPTVPAITTEAGLFNETLYLRPYSGGAVDVVDGGQPGGSQPVGPLIFGGLLAFAGLLTAAAGMRRRHRSAD